MVHGCRLADPLPTEVRLKMVFINNDAERLHRLFDVPFSFEERPIPVPADLRPAWRIPMLLLIVSSCRAQQASWRQLHLLNWAVRTPASRKLLQDVMEGSTPLDKAIVRYEPSLGRAVDLAVGEGFATWGKGRILSLTEEGKEIVRQLHGQADLFVSEKLFLAKVGSSISQALVSRLLEWRRQ